MSVGHKPPRVHVLGLGSIGTFAAHSLAEIPSKPSVTLLLHRPTLMDGYIKNGRRISLKTHDGKTVGYQNYSFEALNNNAWYLIEPDSVSSTANPTNDIIEHLIVCVKATQTVSALRPLLPRLAPYSTILFLQNGAGMIEDVNEHLFQDPNTRPKYISGVISHGVTTNSPFNITHTGFASTSIGLVPRVACTTAENPTAEAAHSEYLLQSLPLSPRFNCRSLGWPDILAVQLEKLATNAFCNPFCALADSPNKYLFTIPETCEAIMSEISSVILALPELKDADIAERFSPAALEATVMSIIGRTRETTCSMVWDLRAGRKTEVRYINGFWSRKGREVGVPTPVNDRMVAEIEAREP